MYFKLNYIKINDWHKINNNHKIGFNIFLVYLFILIKLVFFKNTKILLTFSNI